MLSPEQERRLRDWMCEHNPVHWDNDVEPPGYDLVIDGLGSPWGTEVTAVSGSCRLELGTVVITWSEV
jgi:hypothetical protein